MAEEETVPPAEESSPAPQAEPEAPAVEATLPEASVVDTLVFLSAGAEAERSDIPSAVPVEDVAPGAQEDAIEAPELMEVAAEEAAATAGREDVALP
jgi:hypothetical protein